MRHCDGIHKVVCQSINLPVSGCPVSKIAKVVFHVGVKTSKTWILSICSQRQLNVKVTLALRLHLSNSKLYKNMVSDYANIFIMTYVRLCNLCIRHSYYAMRYSKDAMTFYVRELISQHLFAVQFFPITNTSSYASQCSVTCAGWLFGLTCLSYQALQFCSKYKLYFIYTMIWGIKSMIH